MPIAVIAFDFDPLLRLAEGLVVRWQTLALAAAIAATLLLAALIARRGTLRLDDMLFIAVGTVPGAVIAGRLGYLLLHFEYYAANPSAILDPGLGAMELAFGVVGGLLTGVVRRVAARARRSDGGGTRRCCPCSSSWASASSR